MLYKLYDFTNHCFYSEDFMNEESLLKEIKNISSNIMIQIHEFDDNLTKLLQQSLPMNSDFAKTILYHFEFIGILLSDSIHNSINEFEHEFIVMVNLYKKIDINFYISYPKYSDTVKEMRLFFEINPKIINFLRTKTNTIHKNFCFFETNDVEKMIINKLIKDHNNNFDYYILDKKTLCWI